MSDFDTQNRDVTGEFFAGFDEHVDFKSVNIAVDDGLNFIFDGVLLCLVQDRSSCGATENISLYRTKAGAYICSVSTEKQTDAGTCVLNDAKVIERTKDLLDFLRPYLRTAKKLYASLPAELGIKFERKIA